MRQLKRLLRYVKGTEDMSTVFEMRDNNDRREQLIKRLEVYTDSDWASDHVTRKKHEWCGDHGRRHEMACSQSGSLFSGIEQLRGRGNGSVGRHQGGTVVARSVGLLVWDTMKLKSKWTAARHTHSSINEVLDA